MKEHDLSNEIDSLLTLYLELVDEYDLLRRELYLLQISARQNLARANFNAARGVRYGEEFYDSRMQAQRLCCVTVDAENGKRTFTLFPKDTPKKTSDPSIVNKEEERILDGLPQEKTTKENDTEQLTENISKTGNYDPIRMFGILIPESLRLVQTDYIKMVKIVPRLVELDADLAQAEIEIRRLRKQRTKSGAKVKRDDNQSYPAKIIPYIPEDRISA